MFGLFSGLTNPGRLEELKKEASAVLSPDIFEGARFEFNKTLTQKFALIHSVTLGGGAPGSYELGANVAEDWLLLASRVDVQGRLNGRVNAQVSDSTLVRLQAQVGPSGEEANSFKADLDYKGGSFCVGGYAVGSGLLGANYMQSVTEGLSLGAETFYHTGNSRVRGGAVAARYVWGDKEENVATAKAGTIGAGNLELTYHRKVRASSRLPLACPPGSSPPPVAHRPASAPSPPLPTPPPPSQVSEKVGLATEMQYYHNQFCQFGVGYEFRLRSATFKGVLQSDSTCSASLEERIAPGINLLLSGQLNHKKKDHKFGVGLIVGAA